MEGRGFTDGLYPSLRFCRRRSVPRTPVKLYHDGRLRPPLRMCFLNFRLIEEHREEVDLFTFRYFYDLSIEFSRSRWLN